MKRKQNPRKNRLVTIYVCVLMLVVCIIVVSYDKNANSEIRLWHFNSTDEIKNYLKQTANHNNFYSDNLQNSNGAPTTALAGASGQSSGGADYSKTNNQVDGVDEADIMKTDGIYIYTISDGNIVITKAYPSGEAKVVSRINTENESVGLFINDNKLVEVESNYRYCECYCSCMNTNYYKFFNPETTVKTYDISDRISPVLVDAISINGTYQASRMIGDRVYVISTMYPYCIENDLMLPVFQENNIAWTVNPSDIGYFNVASDYYVYTTIFSINIKTNHEMPNYKIYLTDSAQNIYVSLDNIYLANQGSPYWSFDAMSTNQDTTTVHKISIENGVIDYVGSATVSGHVLNQFSMDEYNGFFRIATTIGQVWGGNSKNSVYIFDSNLAPIGSLENIGKGEKIYSARFMSDRCYLVTFKKTDPFFVIDLKNPYSPCVLGELKMPGYSDYLQPYDENHIIGIGKGAVDEGNFAWYQGIKLSLFDVTDVNHPKETSNFSIGDRGTDSYALSDQKAFLFDEKRNLLVIPISLAKINASKYPDGVSPYAYGDHVWEGAYVFYLSTETGFSLRGGISHSNNTSFNSSWYYDYGQYSIKRILYINDILYTISDKMIKMNQLSDLKEVNEITL